MTFLLPNFSHPNLRLQWHAPRIYQSEQSEESKRMYSDLTLSLRIPTATTKYIAKFIKLTQTVLFCLQNREKADRFAVVLTILGGSPRESGLLPSVSEHNFLPVLVS
jgi:hypothetical protein